MSEEFKPRYQAATSDRYPVCPYCGCDDISFVTERCSSCSARVKIGYTYKTYPDCSLNGTPHEFVEHEGKQLCAVCGVDGYALSAGWIN